MAKKRRAVASNKAPQLIVGGTPFEYVEAYKALRTNFNFIAANGKNRKIVITSTLRDEGKSSVAINLAISLAQTDSKVLLIDADMRNPSVHRYMRLKKDSLLGLSTLLAGDVKVGECLMHTEYGVDVICGGPVPPNPAELVASDAMRELLRIASERYDYIICDAPPVGIITDAAALSPLCDGVLFAIRQGFANKNQVRNAIKSLQAVNAKILGTVMTQYDIPKNPGKRYGNYRGYKYGYGYGYGYGHSHGNDGE